MNGKKLCLAALALGCAAAANAQSSLTLTGVVDLAIQRHHSAGVGSLTSLASSGISTSRVTFRGVEDLGGGLRAGFLLEGGILPDSGLGGATNTNNQSSGAGTGATAFMFNRFAYVHLTGNWGEMRLGRDAPPIHWNNVEFDVFNGLGVGRAGNFSFAGVGNGAMFTTVAVSNTASYSLPTNLGGFFATAMYALGENASNAPNAHDGNMKGLRFGWTNGFVNAAAAYQRTDYLATAAIGKYTHANVGASYKTNVGTLFALVNKVTVALSNGDVDKRSWTIGASIPMTSAGVVRLSLSRLNDGSATSLLNADGSRRSTNDAAQWAVGYVHNLSKRTALYTTYGRINNDGGASYAVTGGPVPVAGGTSSGLQIGVRHAF